MLDFIQLLEGKKKTSELEIVPLKFNKRDISPVISTDALELHQKLAKGYATRYNNNEGDKSFNKAGVVLHNLWFEQFREVRPVNTPNGPMLTFINKHFGSYGEFKDAFLAEALKMQGSGWIYLAYDGTIKTIHNHEIRDDILVLVDMWEHAWILDYGSNKKEYISQLWKIIDWNKISSRWGESL